MNTSQSRAQLVVPVPEELKQQVLRIANENNTKVEEFCRIVFEDYVARLGRFERRTTPRNAFSETCFSNEWSFTGRDLAG